ncbi:MAG: hypothetical protein ACI4DO_02985 [Roseburia sp.]
MKQRIKRLLAVFLVVAAVANCIDFPEYEIEVSAVTAQTGADTLNENGEDSASGVQQDAESDGQSAAISEETDGQSEVVSVDTDGNEDEEQENSGVPVQEVLQEPAVTGEPEMQEIPEENLGAYSAANSQNIPQSASEVVVGKIYYVRTYDDVLALQELSKQSSLKGCIFEFAKLNDTTNTWDLTNIGFQGLGSEEFPFQGTIQEYYESGITFKTKRPLFQYLGSGATVINFNVTLSDATSGMADYLLVTDDSPVTYRNVTLSGTVTNTTSSGSSVVNEGAAGALYGTVLNGKADGSVYTLKIDGTGLSLTGIIVDACIAGGYVGQVKGNVAVQVSDASNLASAVYNSKQNGIALGGIVGKLCNGSSFTVTDDITISNTVGYKVVNGTYTYSMNPQAVGGLIGACEGAVVTSTEKKVTKKTDIFLRGGTAGGFIGKATDSKVDITKFYLDAMIKTSINVYNYTCCAGGVVGVYNTTGTVSDVHMNISRVAVNSKQVSAGDDSDHTYTKSVVAGGVVGSIQGDHVNINNLSDVDPEYPFVPLLGYDAYDNYVQTKEASAGYVGGIAGTVTGQDIQFYDIALSFDKTNNQKIGGKRLGGLVGSVGQQTKMLVTDITIRSMYVNCTSGSSAEIRIPEYAGGLFGYVDKGSIISLGAKDDSKGWDGIIDLKGIVYTNGGLNVAGLRSDGITSKGYIAGAQTESLIYLEGEAVYEKNESALNPDDSVWLEDIYNSSKYYMLDDIGTYGGVYRNIKDENNGDNYVIDFNQSYGSEVTGTVPCAADGSYTLRGDADALRLAIALNTFDGADSNYKLRFASGCFQSGATGKTLLEGKYTLTADLDFAKTGIYSLVRNDLSSGTDMKYAFTGSLTGAKANGEKAEICLNIASAQTYAGLFPTVKDATFGNLKLTGKIYYAANFGGLAYRAEGNLTIQNVDVELAMRTRSYVPSVSSVNYYGGYVGYYKLGTDKFQCSQCRIAPDISNIRFQQIVGGLIGYVDTGKSTPAGDNLILSNISVETKLTTDSKFMNGASNTYFHARMSGLIANLSAVAWSDQSAMNDESTKLESCVSDATYVKVRMTNIVVKDAKIDTSNIAQNTDKVRATGGLLGYQWDNAEVVIDGVTVTGNTQINSRGHVGGLFTSFSGKLDFVSDIDLQSMTMTDSQGNQRFSGLLVGDGRYALITLTAENYDIDSAHVQVNGYMNFDEIVGVSCELAGNQVNSNSCGLATDYKQGGIVNIIMPEFADHMTDSEYTSYKNRVSAQSNPYTRYYYNLFVGYSPVAVSGTTATLDSEEDLMLWHLYEYTSGHGKLKRFLTPYFSAPMDVNGTWKLVGTFDMNGYSFYPTSVTGGTYGGVTGGGTTIVLYAGDITDGEMSHGQECDQRTPGQSSRQHYMMHAGLFQNSSNFKISNITFRGTGANLGVDSGVLCAKTLKGGITIENINLDGVVIDRYDDTCGVGLMLGHVLGEHDDNTVLDINGVKTINYGEGVMAAGALIGCVGRRGESTGTDTVTASMDFKVLMKNMDVEDRKEKVFRYASFICQYYYSSLMDSDTNKIVLYTFTKADADAENVTYGAEIKDGVDYYDVNRDPSDTTDTLYRAIENAKADTYNPYVHTSRYIFVNPRNGNLTTGCGTYEDPYVITDSRQLMNLFLYLTDSSAYDEIFQVTGNEWKVNLVGNGSDDGRCNVAFEDAHIYATYGDDDFPTRDELRTAYYLVTNDLELSQVKDMNDRAMNCDFVGIGTEKYPFAGVLVGKMTDGTRPTITMPSITTAAENYGLIQYMKGGVVKDLVIEQEVDSDDNQEPILIKHGGNGAGVAAVVLGGDNIIDNVQVSLKLTLSNDTDMAKTGAYVGCIRTGGVVLRNLKKENISSYSVSVNGGADPDSAVNVDFASGTGAYKQNCQIIGWVEDGYVLGYLAGTDQKAGQPLLENEQLGITDTYIPLSYSFPIVNGAYIDTGFSDTNKIKVTGNITDGFTVTMHNGQQLEVAALGFNSDAFSIYDSGKTDLTSTNAYDYRAICRKADYSCVGWKTQGNTLESLSQANRDDYTAATTQDDGQRHYPYIYDKYMDFTSVGGYGVTQTRKTNDAGETAALSWLNWTYDDQNSYAVDKQDVVTTYALDKDPDSTGYDLSVYGRSFRGFGALYHKTYSQFKANFDGDGDNDGINANVKIQMERDWDSSISITGMFNGLETMREDSGFTIKNLNIKDSYFKNDNADSVGGAITGYMKGIWTLDNVHLIRTTADAAHKDVENNSHTGGLVGVIRYYSKAVADYAKQQIRFENCGIKGTTGTDASVRLSSKVNVGGILGYVEGYNNSADTSPSSYYGDLYFTDCQVSYGDVYTTGGNAGGFIGRVGDSYNHYVHNSAYGRSVGTVTIKRNASEGGTYPVSVEHSNIQVQVPSSSASFFSAGGLVGSFYGRYEGSNSNVTSRVSAEGIVLDTVTVCSNTATSNTNYTCGIGGILGGAWANTVSVSDVSIKASDIEGIRRGGTTTTTLPTAGVVGAAFANYFDVDNVSIANTNITSYSNSVAGVLSSTRIITDIDVQDVTIENSTLKSEKSAAGGVIGTNNIRTVTQAGISGVKILNSNLYAGCSETTGESTTHTIVNNASTASAGGVVGYSSYQMNQLTISDVQVGNGSNLAGYCVGGVIGTIGGYTIVDMQNKIYIGCHETGVDGQVEKDTASTILYGKWRNGGIVGSDTTTRDGKYSAVIRVYNTKVGAYGTETASDRTAMAGGLVGYVSGHNTIFDDVEVKDCSFAVTNTGSINAAAGSLWGSIGDGTHKIYQPVIENNSTGYVGDATLMDTLEEFAALPDANLGLVYNGSKTTIQRWNDSAVDLSESNVSHYSYGLGNYIGTRTGGTVYILRPELIFGSGFTGNRPAIDVGNTNGKTDAAYETEHGYGFPYNYRENVHIVYFEPDSAATNPIEGRLLSESVFNGTAGETEENEYLFSSLDTFAGAYQDENCTGADFLSDYNLNVTINNMKVINLRDAGTDSYYDMLDTAGEKKYIKKLGDGQIQCLYADGVGAQDLMESMIDILTNSGGGDSTRFDENLSIKAVSAKITNDGQIVANPDKESSVEVVGNKVQYRPFSADEPIVKEDGTVDHTITLLIYNYGWNGADGERKSETIYIPVFVVERITLYNDLHILEGEQYSIDRAKDSSVSYQGQVTVAHDSTYTLYSELAYSSAREKEAYQEFTIAKKLQLWQQQSDFSWALAEIPRGLQFTLVDVSTGKAYYYTSDGSEHEIDFTDFKDRTDGTGTAYSYQPIGSLNTTQTGYTYGGSLQAENEEFGVERFFIYVEPSQDAAIANSVFKWAISTEDTSSYVGNFLDQYKDYSEIEITWMPGLDISFKEKQKDSEGNVQVLQTTADVLEGSAINQDQKVTVTAAINIMADQEYWNQKAAANSRFIDSENNGKYLDVAIYLIDKASGEYVTLPPGTFLRLNGADSGHATTGQSVTYAYQQWGLTFPLAELTENVQGWNQTIDSSAGSDIYQNTFTLEMDFASANIDDYAGNTYELYMELRRTSDPEYPLEGSKLDSYSERVESYGNKELATTVEVNDISKLGINTYNQTESTYTIPFTTKLDFANMIYNEADVETCANSDYLITYRIKKKVQTGTDTSGRPIYEYRTVGSAENAQTMVGADNSTTNVSDLKVDEELILSLPDGGADQSLIFNETYGADGSQEPVYQMIKRFSKDDIKDGTDGVDYLLTWDLELKVDTTNIKNFDLSNYMVEVTVLPFDPGLASSEPNTTSITIDGADRTIPKTDSGSGIGSSLKDYYIFTIGKLKTDL